MQINITEAAAPKNAATIDKDGLTGNTYTKNEIQSEISKSFVGSIKGEAIPTTVPTVYNPTTHPNGLYEKYDVKTEGTYTNFKNASNVALVVLAADLDKKQTQLWVENGVAKKIVNELPIITAKTVFDGSDDVNPATMKAVGKRYDNANRVLQYFTDLQTNGTQVTGFVGNTYLKVDGTAFSSNGNKALLNIDVTNFDSLKYNCFPAVIIGSLQSQYCSIVAEKSDGTKVVLRGCKIIDGSGSGQTSVDETYDLSLYVKLHLSIGDMAASLGQTPNILLFGGASGDVPIDAVKTYIDEKTTESAGSVNEKIGVLETILKYFKDLRTDSTPVTAFIPRTYLKRDGSSFTGDGNKAIFNIDVTTFEKLKFNCFPAIIVAASQNEYCSILAEKADGTKVMLRACTVITSSGGGQELVDEEYDLVPYVKLHLSIGDMAASLGQIPNILLLGGIGEVPIDAVKTYIDEKTKGTSGSSNLKGNITLNTLETFSTNDVTIADGASISSGLINFSGSSTVTVKENTLNENSDMSFIYQELSASNAMIGFKSYNGHGYNWDVFVKYNTSGTNIGKLEIRAGNGLAYSQLSLTSNTNYTIGDIMKIGIIRKGLKYTMYVQNISKNWKMEMSQLVTPLGVPFIAHNSACPQFISNSGTGKILKYSHTCFSFNIENAINGDSITFGQSATSEELRWANIIKGNNLVMGGGADTSASVLARLPEIIKIKPRRVLLMIGGNDILFGLAPSVWQQNLRDIRSQLVAAGIEVVHCLPTPRAGAGTLISFIKSEPKFLTDLKVDTNTTLMNGNSDNIKTEFDSGDHLHPNNAGMAEVGKIINQFLI
jgi:lysophospholipase L1-like esterase